MIHHSGRVYEERGVKRRVEGGRGKGKRRMKEVEDKMKIRALREDKRTNGKKRTKVRKEN